MPLSRKPILGLVTIGQTPRPDLEKEFQLHSPSVEICVRGALDGLSHSEVAELMEVPGDYPLLVRLSDGSAVEIQMTALAPKIEFQAHRLAEAGATLVVIVCTGAFPEFFCSIPILWPGKILPAITRLFSRTGRIGVVTPVAGQVPAAEAKWIANGFCPKVTYASPYQHPEIVRAAQEMADPDLELVVLDCMGHNANYRSEFACRSGRPVLLAQSVVARLASEFVALE